MDSGKKTPLATFGWIAAFILIGLWALFPVVWTLSLSLKSSADISNRQFWPTEISWENYDLIINGAARDLFLPALRNSIAICLIATLIAVILSTLAAYAIARLEFPGKRFFNAIIDLPFALPTIVASIVLLSLYGPTSPVGIQLSGTRWGLAVALAFVTLPFVVRSVQPVLIEADREVEQAAASLGAGPVTILTRIILPALWPAILGGAGLAFARALGEYGSVVLIGGNIPRQTQVASQYIQQQIEIDRPVNGAAVSVLLLHIALVSLVALRLVSSAGRRRQERAA